MTIQSKMNIQCFYLSSNSWCRGPFLGMTPSMSSFSGFNAVFTALQMTEFRRILSCASSMSRSVSIFVVSSSVMFAFLHLFFNKTYSIGWCCWDYASLRATVQLCKPLESKVLESNYASFCISWWIARSWDCASPRCTGQLPSLETSQTTRGHPFLKSLLQRSSKKKIKTYESPKLRFDPSGSYTRAQNRAKAHNCNG